MIKAVIDLGTNTFQLLVAQWDGYSNSFKILENRTHAVTLGKGAMEGNVIQEEAIDRARRALSLFSEIIQQYPEIQEVTAIGTAVIRNARNGQILLDNIQDWFGFTCIKIDGAREAELIFKGVVESMPQPWVFPSLIMDIGGGSTEFILYKGRDVLFKQSFEIGGLKLLSLFHKNGEFDRSQLVAMENYILKQIPTLLEAIKVHQPIHLIGAAGAFETLFDLERVRLNKESVKAFAKELSIDIFYEHKRLLEQLSLQEREVFPGMKPFRAGILPMAMLEIDLVLRHFCEKHLWFSDFSLKEGYFFETVRNS